MKRIELYVDGQHFVIEECEGRAEIRYADQPRAMAGARVTAYVGAHRLRDHENTLGHPIELKVETRE